MLSTMKIFGIQGITVKFPKIDPIYIFSQMNYHSACMLRGQYTGDPGTPIKSLDTPGLLLAA